MKKTITILVAFVMLVNMCSLVYGASLFEELEDYGGNIADVPSVHPRVFFTEKDIPSIIANTRNAENKNAMEAFNKALSRNTMNVLDENSEDNANNNVLFAIQAKAFNHVVFGGNSGSDAVSSMVDYLEKFRFPEHDFSLLRSYHQVTYTMYTASLVYDWCYDILSSEQEKYIREKLLELAEGEHEFNSLTYGLNPFGGTGTSNYLFRDFLAMGIALYDTNPEIFNFINDKIENVYNPIDEYFSKSGSAFYGYQYGAFAAYGHIMAYRLMSGIGKNAIFSENLFHTLDYFMASRLPDGNNLVEGDDYLSAKGQSQRSMDDSSLVMISAAAAFYTKNPKFKSYLKDLSLTYTSFWYGTTGYTPIDAFLLVDAQGSFSEYKQPDSLYFGSPMGMIIASNGEDEDKTVVRMKISERYRWHHQHYDAGSFEIYYKGRLTGQSAQYSRTDIDQYSNYYVQSVASNTLLIKDPQETFTYWSSYKIAENSGGQLIKRNTAQSLEEWDNNPLMHTGEITGYKSGEEFSYISGDITDAYSDKVSEVKRSMAYIPQADGKNGGVMFVIDKIVATDESYKKTFLLHLPSEPIVNGNTAVVNYNGTSSGRMTLKALYPEVIIEEVGGEGKQWYVNGTNYEPLESYAPELKNNPFAYGWGRLEVSPKETNKQDYLVNVIYIDDTENPVSTDAKVVESDTVIGAETENNAVLMAKTDAKRLEFTTKEATDIRIGNIACGYWDIYKDGEYISSVYADSESFLAEFQTTPGEITIKYSENGKFSGGLGTEAVPYVIKTEDDFLAMTDMETSGVYFIQANDISLGNYEPFPFGGVYNGNGNKINVEIRSENEGVGLFSNLKGNAEVKSVVLHGSISGSSFVGGIAGKIESPKKIKIYDCVNYCDVEATVKGAGGFIGEAYYSSGVNSSTVDIHGLENYGTITAPYWAGGISGVSKVNHTSVKNSGNINSPSTSGGVIGLSYATVSEASNEGRVSGNPAGGIAGHIINGSILNSFNCGEIATDVNKVTGGIVGTADRTTIRYCYDSGYLNNPNKQIVGNINSDKGETVIKNCYYLNPAGQPGISGTFPLTSEQLKGFSISSSFAKSNTAYLYPQIKSLSPVKSKTQVVKVSVVGDNCTVYPFKGEYFVRKDSDLKIVITPDKYYKLNLVKINGKEISYNGSHILSDVNDDVKIEIATAPYSPGISSDILEYTGDYKKSELAGVVPDYIKYHNKYGALVCAKATGIFSDCGFAVSDNGKDYELISCYGENDGNYSFGMYLCSSTADKKYIRPYVVSADGKIYYGNTTYTELRYTK